MKTATYFKLVSVALAVAVGATLFSLNNKTSTAQLLRIWYNPDIVALQTIIGEINNMSGLTLTAAQAGGIAPLAGLQPTAYPNSFGGLQQVSGGPLDLSTVSIGSGGYSEGGGGGASAGPSPQEVAQRQAALYQINNGLTSANSAYGRLDGQQATGIANIGKSYEDAYQRLLGQQKLGQADYTQNTTNQLNEYQTARNASAGNARSWADGAQRQLGANGAGGGSAARYAVPYEAQQIASKGNAAAQSVNNRNIISLDQNWRRAQDDFTNSQSDLTRQRQTGENDLKTKVETQRADLLGTIAQLTGQQTIANGGNYDQALAASQAYTSRIPGIMNTIDGLAVSPALKERAVTIGRPDLSAYNWSRPDAAPQPQQDASLRRQSVNPLLGLYGQPQDDQLQYA